MDIKRLGLAAGMLLTAHVACAQGFSDNVFSYRYQPFSREPGISPPVAKHVLNLSHVDAGKNWIDNFFSIDALQSDHNDPAKGGTNGATEVYAVYRGDVNNMAALGHPVLAIPGFIRDVSLQIGGDFNTKNTAFAGEKKLIVAGPNIHFDTPGFLNLAIHIAHEWNYNGIVGKSVNFDPTAEFEVAGMYPLTFTGLPLRLQGFTNVVLPKGKDGFGASTVTEWLLHAQIALDLGDLVWHKPNIFDVFVGYQYWLNKFGGDHNKITGAEERTPYFGFAVHF